MDCNEKDYVCTICRNTLDEDFNEDRCIYCGVNESEEAFRPIPFLKFFLRGTE